MYIHLIGNKKMNLDELNATIHSYEQQIKYLRRHKITLKEKVCHDLSLKYQVDEQHIERLFDMTFKIKYVASNIGMIIELVSKLEKADLIDHYNVTVNNGDGLLDINIVNPNLNIDLNSLITLTCKANDKFRKEFNDLFAEYSNILF